MVAEPMVGERTLGERMVAGDHEVHVNTGVYRRYSAAATSVEGSGWLNIG